MAIRTNTNPRQMDLQPEMRDMLMRNGLQAHVALDDAGYRLIGKYPLIPTLWMIFEDSTFAFRSGDKHRSRRIYGK